jgi:tRNA dimethylallyltransferase
MIPLIVIEGPTAVGKSRIALQLAEKLGNEIISADSRQIYRYMDIGTAKPTVEERKRVEHHLVDIIEPYQEYSAGQYAVDAAAIIRELQAESKVPIVCGGTGFYIKSLLEGLFEAPAIPATIREDLRALEDSKGTEYLNNMLKKIDPLSAERIHPNDSYRIKRALEVWITTGKGMGQHWEEQKSSGRDYKPFRILVTEDRQVLYERINKRIDMMIDKGLIDEIRLLLNRGYKEDDPGMTSVGYREFIPFIRENASFFSCLEEAKQNSRNYAKRQFTWYRKIDFDLVIESNHDISDLNARIKNFLEKSDKTLS